jgi:hypothetical protein
MKTTEELIIEARRTRRGHAPPGIHAVDRCAADSIPAPAHRRSAEHHPERTHHPGAGHDQAGPERGGDIVNLNPLTIWRNRKVRRAAEKRYWEIEECARYYHGRLAEPLSTRDRGTALHQLGRAEKDMADLHQQAFGPDVDDDGWDLAESHRHSGMLLDALGDVEWMVDGAIVSRHHYDGTFGEEAALILDAMCAMPNLEVRTAMLQVLAEAIRPYVGSQVVETLHTLPSPGHVGWLTTAEHDAWLAEAESAL